MVEKLNSKGKEPAFRSPKANSLSELEEKITRMKFYTAEGQTADFSEFAKKVEEKYGRTLDEIARENPGAFPHVVLAHGFMEYANVRGLLDPYGFVKKEDYLDWAKAIGVSEKFIEKGWEEFVND